MIGLDDIIGAGLRIVDKLVPDPQARAAAAPIAATALVRAASRFFR